MSILNKVVALLLVALLMGCGSTSDALNTGSGADADDISPENSVEDLYFELMRLESAGLLPSGRIGGEGGGHGLQARRLPAAQAALGGRRGGARPGSTGLHPALCRERAGTAPAAGGTAADIELRAGTHVGVSSEIPRRGRENVWNPTNQRDNCTACVATVIRNSLEGYFKHSADDMERLFGYAGHERQFTVDESLQYIENATGLKATSKPVSMLGDKAVVGHYAVFVGSNNGQYRHVMYGRVTPTGRVTIFDPQSMEHMTYPQMLKRYSKAAPYLLGVEP